MPDLILRTPEERFVGLPDFPWQPKYLEVKGVRMARIDEGPPEAPVALLLHGEPSWSFLYRKMIPGLLAGGMRVVAPDLVGFGRSDKPADPRAYTYQAHVDWLSGLIAALDLKSVMLFCQDWGGLLGLRIVGEQPERFARVCASNTGLPTGDQAMPGAFKVWRAFALYSPWFPIGRIVQSGVVRGMTPAVRDAYDAPFPSAKYQVAARAFPRLVPTTPDDPASAPNRAAWETLKKFDKPFLTLFGKNDPITRGGNKYLQSLIPGCKDQPHELIRGAGHFIQEDAGPELTEALLHWREG